MFMSENSRAYILRGDSTFRNQLCIQIHFAEHLDNTFRYWVDGSRSVDIIADTLFLYV